MAVLSETARMKVGLDLPRREMRAGFTMTAMADMLFQLLIFFMLSANLTVFGMLDIRTGALAAEGAGDARAPDGAVVTPLAQTAIWTLSQDQITAGGQRFELAQLDRLADALADQGTANLLLVLRGDLAVGQLVTVLERLQARGISAVQIADGGAS